MQTIAKLSLEIHPDHRCEIIRLCLCQSPLKIRAHGTRSTQRSFGSARKSGLPRWQTAHRRRSKPINPNASSTISEPRSPPQPKLSIPRAHDRRKGPTLRISRTLVHRERETSPFHAGPRSRPSTLFASGIAFSTPRHPSILHRAPSVPNRHTTKFAQRRAASCARNLDASGQWLGINTIRSFATPAPHSASATERNEDPLSPGPSSTTRNKASERILPELLASAHRSSNVTRSNGCPSGRAENRRTAAPRCRKAAAMTALRVVPILRMPNHNCVAHLNQAIDDICISQWMERVVREALRRPDG